MSRSQPTLQNPAEHFFKWAGSTGELQYWDKEKEQSISVPLPFEFLVLDELATITGYSKPKKTGYWSNEVRNTKREEFVVHSKNGIEYTGLYKNEQGIAQIPRECSYTQSIYIAHKNRAGEYIMGNIKASGSARGAWFDFVKEYKVENGKVIMTKGEQQEAQTGPFFPPVFKYVSSTPEEDAAANKLDGQLQIYLSQYLAAPKFEDHELGIGDGMDKIGRVSDEEAARLQALPKRSANLDLTPDPMERVHNARPFSAIDDLGNADEEISLNDIPDF